MALPIKTSEILKKTGGNTFVAGINNQTGTTYTLIATDAGKVVRLDNANPITLTVPKNATVEIPVNTIIRLCQAGAGAIEIAPEETGPDVPTLNGLLNSDFQYAYLTLIKVADDVWDVVGGVSGE